MFRRGGSRGDRHVTNAVQPSDIDFCVVVDQIGAHPGVGAHLDQPLRIGAVLRSHHQQQVAILGHAFHRHLAVFGGVADVLGGRPLDQRITSFETYDDVARFIQAERGLSEITYARGVRQFEPVHVLDGFDEVAGFGCLSESTGDFVVMAVADQHDAVAVAREAHRFEMDFGHAQSPGTTKLEFFTPDQAKEIDAITSRIIPTDETPGAHEAGVVYFIDRALTTFAIDNQKIYREGLPEMQARTHELFSALDQFSAATPEQQDEVLHSFDEQTAGARRPYRPRAAAQSFFDTVRLHTVVAFLLDPEIGRAHV